MNYSYDGIDKFILFDRILIKHKVSINYEYSIWNNDGYIDKNIKILNQGKFIFKQL